MNFREMRQRTARMLGVTPTSRLHWTKDQIERAINRAYREVARRTGCLEMREDIAVSNGQGHYTTSDELRRLIRVSYDDRLLCASTFWEMDRTRPLWEDQYGYVETFVEDRRDDRVLRLYRIPEGTGHVFAADTANNSAHTDKDFGVVAWTDVETTTFTADTANNAAHTDADLGIVVHWEMTDGTVMPFVDDAGGTMDSGVTVMADIGDFRLRVWGKRNPPRLAENRDTPEIPAYAHLGVCYIAASRLLMQRGDGRAPERAKLYKALGEETMDFLRQEVSRRTPERMYILGNAPGRKGRMSRAGRFLLGNAPIPSS